MSLTDSRLRTIKATGKVQKISDGGGLYAHVTDKGSILWRMAYRYGGKQKNLSLGIYPAISLSQARLLREQARQKLAQGVDPSIEKRERKAQAKADTNKSVGMSFKNVAKEWYDIKKSEWGEKVCVGKRDVRLTGDFSRIWCLQHTAIQRKKGETKKSFFVVCPKVR